jgi:hypothetical protein
MDETKAFKRVDGKKHTMRIRFEKGEEGWIALGTSDLLDVVLISSKEAALFSMVEAALVSQGWKVLKR